MICGLLIVIFLSLILLVFSFTISRDYERKYTSAVCDGNVCRDFEFTCNDGEIVRLRAISGFVIFGEDWVDLREDKNRC